MMRIFLDSSVFFSAGYSEHGFSRDLLLMGAKEEVVLLVSELVIEGTRRNIAYFAPDKVKFLDQLVGTIPFEYAHPTKHEVLAAAEIVEFKDAPIVAAAKKSKADLLVTLDKKHLLGKPD